MISGRRAVEPVGRGSLVWDFGSQRVNKPNCLRPLLPATLLALASCVGETPPNEIPAPDSSKITVFYPIDGLVHARGAKGSALYSGPSTDLDKDCMPSGCVSVIVRPSGTFETQPVNSDGSFSISVAAVSGDVLEFATATKRSPQSRGASAFIRVPQGLPPEDPFVCCIAPGATQGKCQRVVRGKSCDFSGPPIPLCTAQEDCAPFSGQLISIPEDALEITPPDASGRITVRSRPKKLPPLTLVRYENRGQRAVGGESPNTRGAEVTDEDGVFTATFRARGDDELVFQLSDLEAIQSRQHAAYVPDSPLADVDVVGVYPFEGLAPGRTGKVAIRVSPFGMDKKGICPDSSQEPALCFSGGTSAAPSTTGKFNGGLDYSMVTIQRLSIEGNDVTARVQAATSSASLPNTRATDGDVLAGPQILMLLLDNSAEGSVGDSDHIRYRAARDFVNALRKRDQMGIIVFGRGDPMSEKGWEEIVQPTSEKQKLLAAVTMAESQEGGGKSDIFGAVLRAATVMEGVRSTVTRGGILIITATQPTGDAKAALQALDAIDPDEGRLFPGYATYVVASGLPPPGTSSNTDELQDLAFFTSGDFVQVQEPRGMLQAVARQIGKLSGAFVLLYDVPIPERAGKSAHIELDLSVTLPGLSGGQQQSATTSYVGDIEVREARN